MANASAVILQKQPERHLTFQAAACKFKSKAVQSGLWNVQYTVSQKRIYDLFTYYFFESKADRCWPIVVLVRLISQMLKVLTIGLN
jgi:hypothetical protein